LLEKHFFHLIFVSFFSSSPRFPNCSHVIFLCVNPKHLAAQIRQKLLEAGHAALQSAHKYPNEPVPEASSSGSGGGAGNNNFVSNTFHSLSQTFGSNSISAASSNNSSPPPVCTRAPAFLKPGPLIIGGVGDSGTSAVVSLCQSAVKLQICSDYGGSLDALYLLKPETVYPDILAGNNSLQSAVHHLPWLLEPQAPGLWNSAFRDVCGAVGTTIDCLMGCSVLRRAYSGNVRTLRKHFKLVADR